MPGPMALAAAASPSLARAVAVATGSMLRNLGINMNYGPVGDVNSEPLNPVIGVRSPGDDPHQVSRFATACAQGLRDSRVASCIKHFPGHGDTKIDSHYGLPVIHKSRQDLEATELIPFRHAVADDIDMVMTAHIALPKLEHGSNLPATLSSEAVGILRDDIGFEGVIMSDCMEMDGVRATYGTVEASLMALQAGVDNIMICHTYEVQAEAINRVCRALESGSLTQERIEASLRRLRQLKSRYTSWGEALSAASPESLDAINQRNDELARQVYRDSATLVRSQAGLLPLSRTANTIFVSPAPNIPLGGGAVSSGDVPQPTRVPWVSSSFGYVLRTHNPTVLDIRFTQSTLEQDQWRLLDEADVVILVTRNARESKWQADLGIEVARRRGDRPLVVVAACNPYDFLDYPEVKSYMAIYEPTMEAFAAAADILYGKAPARGKLPVAHTLREG